MVFDPKNTNKIVSKNFPLFKIGSSSIQYIAQFKYLGHVISNSVNDDEDIQREIRNMFIRSQVHYIWIPRFVQYSWRFVTIFIFLNDPTEFRNQCFHFHQKLFGRHLGHWKWPPSGSHFCPLFCAQVRCDDEFGGNPYILGANGNDGTIQYIFGWRPLSNPRWLPLTGSHSMKYWTAMYTWQKWMAQTYHHDWVWYC